MVRKNIRVKIYIAICVIIVILSTQQVSAMPGVRSGDLSYTFTNRNQTEFYNSNTTQIYNITEGLPSFIFDIIGPTPQPVHNSEFGINIVLPGGNIGANPANNRPPNAPASAHTSNTANAPSQVGAPANPSSVSSDTAPNTSLQPRDVQYPGFTFEENTNPFSLTPVAQVRRNDGTIGTLSIPRIGLNMNVYDGDTFEAMLRGAGHIASTSAWNGNIGLTGHNRGVVNNFGRLQELVAGDIIQYTTTLGTRQYRVTSVQRVAETDWSKLQFTRLFPSTNSRICLSDLSNRTAGFSTAAIKM